MDQGDARVTEVRLDDLFRTYRGVCPDLEVSANFVPNILARIEAREISTNRFGPAAKVRVTPAPGLSAILGMLISPRNQSSAFCDATFVEALRADRASAPEPLHQDRISRWEAERGPQRLR
jgi:hypothetical protein